MDIFEQLRRDEGIVRHAYQDHLGYWTIGVGHLVDQRKGGGLSDNIINLILQEDVREKTLELHRKLPWLNQLDPVRQFALVNMAFQLGVEGLSAFNNMLRALQDQRFALAASHALDSKWAKKDTPERARRMARQIETGEWQ